MMDALQRLLLDGEEACLFHGLITGAATSAAVDDSEINAVDDDTLRQLSSTLNESQIRAAVSWRNGPLSLIWGPPGMLQPNVLAKLSLKI